MSEADLAHALAQSWPCARSFDVGPFTLHDGQGGGKRVSAASLSQGEYSAAALDQAEDAMRALGQAPLFVIRPDSPADARFDAALDARGYRLIEPSLGYIAPISQMLAHDVDAAHIYAHWPPLAVCNDLWQAADVGPARRAIMARAHGPKAVIMARQGDDIAGVCFAAIVGQTVMIHATYVAPSLRRQGSAQKLMQRAAIWAAAQGAVNLGLVVTSGNTPARALFEKLGMRVWAGYHYRQLV